MKTIKSQFRDALIIGFAMFAVFFGAGNLIFPPQIGFTAGDSWAMALAGLSLTGMLLPILGVIAIGLGGGSFERLTRPISPWFGTVLIFTTMIAIAWLITIPRTAGVAFETGVMTLIPSINPKIGIAIFVPLYFLVSLYFAIDKNQMIDKVGRILTPILLLLLITIVIWAIVDPLGIPVKTPELKPFYLGFTTGYQTGDVFTGLLFGGLYLEAIRARGYEGGTSFRNVMIGMACVTFLGLFVVYGGLEYLGATGSGLLDKNYSHSALLVELVTALAGRMGAAALAVAVLLACLTTAVGATAVMAEYMTKWSRGRLSYRTAVIITTGMACLQAFGGVQYIIGVAGPIFMLFYPVGICIVVLGLFSPLFNNDGVWKGTAFMALLIGAYDCIHVLSGMFDFSLPQGVIHIYYMIPLATPGFAWVIPAIVGGISGGIAWRFFVKSSADRLNPEEVRTEFSV